MTDWREEEVGNETSSREINEWIDESAWSPDTGDTNPYVCECSDGACKATIALTRVEYEEVRAYGTHFAIARDHESPDLDVMVSERRGSRSSARSRGCRRGWRTPRILAGRRPDRDPQKQVRRIRVRGRVIREEDPNDVG